MTSKTYGVGIIGCGEIAQLMHLPIIAELPRLKVAALCDLSAEVLGRLSATYGGATYADFADLIADPAVDVVVICTYDHGPVVDAVLNAGKPFVVEKPLAFTAAEARDLVRRAEAAGTKAIVGYMKLFDPGLVAGLEALGRMDDLRMAQVHNFAGRFDRYGQLYTQVRGTDVDRATLAQGQAKVAARIDASLGDHAGYRELYLMLLMLGSHNLALMRDAFGTAQGVHYARAMGQSHIYALLDLPGGLPCTFEVAFGHQYEWWDEWIHVWGRDAELRIDLPNPYVRNHAARVSSIQADGQRTRRSVTEALPDTAFRQQWSHFLAVLDGEVEARSTLRGGLDDLELAEAIIKALPPKPA